MRATAAHRERRTTMRLRVQPAVDRVPGVTVQPERDPLGLVLRDLPRRLDVVPVPAGAYWGGETPWISALSLKSPWIDDSDRKLTVLGTENGTRLAPKETVIFVVRGSSLKDEFRIGITRREVAFGQDCKALTPRVGVDAHLLFHAIRPTPHQGRREDRGGRDVTGDLGSPLR